MTIDEAKDQEQGTAAVSDGLIEQHAVAEFVSAYGQWNYPNCGCTELECSQCCSVYCDLYWCAPCDVSRVWSAAFNGRPNTINLPVCLTYSFVPTFNYTIAALFMAADPTLQVACFYASNLAFFWGFHTYMRARFAGTFQIPEHTACTAMMGICCPACSAVQMMLQLQDHHTPAGGQCCWRPAPMVQGIPQPPVDSPHGAMCSPAVEDMDKLVPRQPEASP